VLPADVLAAPTPSPEDARARWCERAARAHGVATESDLRDYYRLGVEQARGGVRDLVEEGVLLPVAVEGWDRPGWLHRDAALPRGWRRPRCCRRSTRWSGSGSRTSRLFGFDYRIEIYVPAPKRVHGYYVLPFLHDEALRARVDLKADRRAGVLRVQAAWLEPAHDAGGTAAPWPPSCVGRPPGRAGRRGGRAARRPRPGALGALAPGLDPVRPGTAAGRRGLQMPTGRRQRVLRAARGSSSVLVSRPRDRSRRSWRLSSRVPERPVRRRARAVCGALRQWSTAV
jgi:hypothetical protein